MGGSGGHRGNIANKLKTLKFEMDSLYVIKIGGNIIDDDLKLSSFLQAFTHIKGPRILVHGGGKMATRLAESMGVNQQMIEGRRVTDAGTLKIVTMVYAGYINKNIVAQLQFYGCNAIGLSGADGNLIKSRKRGSNVPAGIKPSDYGFVGDVETVNDGLLKSLLNSDHCIVVAPISHDGNGLLLNTNADTIAMEIAVAMIGHFDVSLIYCFEKEGVLMDASDEESIIPQIDTAYFEELKTKEVVIDGMLPKMQNAFSAINAGVSHVSIGHADNIKLIIDNKSGTNILA